MKHAILLLSLLVFVSCNKDDGGSSELVCTTQVFNALEIRVIDSTNGQAVISGITVTATDGSFSQELGVQGEDWVGAAGRQGTYTVSVTSTQYTPAMEQGIVVGRTTDNCHVVTEQRQLFVSPF